MLTEFLKSLDVTTIAVLAGVLGLTWWLLKSRQAQSGLPPGPRPFPIFGNMLAFGRAPMDKVMMKWRKQYGDIHAFYMGGQLAITVCGYDNLKELLTQTGDIFLDRPYMFIADIAAKGSKGIGLSNGVRWRETRRFTLMSMRDFGVGRQSLRDKVVEESAALCALLETKSGTAFNLKPYLTNSVSNVICSVVFGRRFEFGDREFVEAMDAISQLIHKAGAGAIINFIPWLRFLPGMSSSVNIGKVLENFIQRKIVEHRSNYDRTKPPHSFLDLYMQVEQGQSEFDSDIFDEDHMLMTIMDLFFAGTESTGTTLQWAVLYLSLYPEVQVRCREEIRSLLGAEGVPELEHRQSLPFVEATMLEVQRCGDITAVGVFRAAARDTTFKGFRVPKGTMVFPLFHSIHRDPQRWPDPDAFRPERWLDAQGKVIHHEAFIPFSLGRRNCIGENLAKIEFFIFFVAIFQRLQFSIPEGRPRPTTDGIVGIARVPHPFDVLVKRVQ